MANSQPRRSSRLARLAEIEREEEEEAWNEIHLFHFRHYFWCCPLDLETKLNEFKLMNDRTDQRFKKERLASLRRTLTEMYGRRMKESVDKFNKKQYGMYKDKPNEVRGYHAIIHVYFSFRDRKPHIEEWVKKDKENYEEYRRVRS